VRRYPSFDIQELVKSGGSRSYTFLRLPPKILAMVRDTTRALKRTEDAKGKSVLWALTWWPEGLVAFLVSNILKIPYVITAHGREAILSTTARRHFLYKKIFDRAACVFAVSNHTAGCLEQSGVAQERIRVIHNGVRPDRFRLNEDRKRLILEVRERFGLEQGFVLLTIARLVARKGHRAVLEAMAELGGRIPALRYLIAGEGPEKDALAEATRELGLEDVVTFVGEVSDEEKIALLHACDVFVMPNRDVLRADGFLDTEGFGIVFLEASACSKPVIGGRAGGVPEAVLDGRTGVLVDPSGHHDLADAIHRLWSDRGMAERLGREGKARVEAEFNWERLTEKHARELKAFLHLC
jgi:phosphatidylinositol alpha-1,6-mannosyltransferase